MVDTESHPRPRRTRHDSAKHYDAQRKDLELTQVLDVLQCYVDYGGGINCCVCGKLYKSRVCFIKHLWEHTIYWDQFAGDKNHMRVLSIQAALILYGSCQQPMRNIPVDSLLVTSPHTTEHSTDGKSSAIEAANAASKVNPSCTPKKESVSRNESVTVSRGTYDFSTVDAAKMLPTTPERKCTLPCAPKAPVKRHTPSVLKSSHKRKTPPKLDLRNFCNSKPSPSVVLSPTREVQLVQSPSPLMFSQSTPFLYTPVKQRIPCMEPKTPKKKTKKRQVNSGSSCSHAKRRISEFFTPSSNVSSNDHCWKETDSCSCKRKRAE
ncbi:uncharacterized protein [Littorina saxatilis]|uniref:C2H2-type domain-containing protein n=1 Tax=Littorina saxatilis TaxID=31220 RepID=A0AAN9BVY8_9CAEN